MVEYGLQMYSVRDITKENLKDALRQVAEMGYKYVEFAGFFGNSAEDVKSWLDEYGLQVSGTHTGCKEITPDAIKDTVYYTPGDNKTEQAFAAYWKDIKK